MMNNSTSKIGSQLKRLSNFENTFDNPFQDDAISNPIILPREESIQSKTKSKDKKKDKLARIIENGEKLNQRFSDSNIAYFDGNLEEELQEYTDPALKTNLIALGRKYARDTIMSAESEIAKQFSGNTKILNTLLEEIDRDKTIIQKNIDGMLAMRTNRNYKTLSELIMTKGQYHNTALSVVRELNNMKKTEIDLTLKSTKNQTPEEMSSAGILQKIVSMGRNTLVGPSGGYTSVSGSFEDYNETNIDFYTGGGLTDNDTDDRLIQEKYFDNNKPESDGDRFLKYEDRGVEYILLIDDGNNKQIIAEDKFGNIVPDYPMPTNINQLNFDISEANMTATDDFHRIYKVRYI